MKYSVEMKNSLAIVLFALCFVHIWSVNLKPNIELSFVSISSDSAIEYYVNLVKPIILNDLKPFIYSETEIKLKAIQLGSCRERCWYMDISNRTYVNKNKCDSLIVPIREISQELYDIKPLHYQGEDYEVFNIFVTEIDMVKLLDFYECENLDNIDKMQKKQQILILYKHSDNTTINIWNTTFTFYNKMYGYHQIVDDETDTSSTKENVIALEYSMDFCQQYEAFANKIY